MTVKQIDYEGAVASVLWDTKDGANEGFDVISNREALTWNIVTVSWYWDWLIGQPTILSFRSKWSEGGLDPIMCEYTVTSCSPTSTRVIGLSGDLAFGNLQVGTSSTRTLTINNTGNATLTVSSISYPTGFSGAWSGTVAAGGSQSVAVTFSPSAATSYGGTVTVTSDKTSGTNTMSASGTGTAPNGAFFEDNMENSAGAWNAQPPWAVTTEYAHSGTHAWSDSPAALYGPNLNTSIWSRVIDLSSAVAPQLTFWQRRDFASDGDAGHVWVTEDGGSTYTYVAGYSGVDPSWTQTSIGLSAHAGAPSVQIVFQVLSNEAVSGDGWYIDDVAVTEGTSPPTCASFSISPASANPSYVAGSTGVTVTGSPAGCTGTSWTASGNGPWITVFPTSGSGSSAVTVSWAQNTSTAFRSGTATIAGSGFTVNQGGAAPSITDSPLIGGSTVVKAIHITEVRQAIDTLRTRFSLGAFAWTDATIAAGLTPVKAAHLTELRMALNGVYAAAGRTAPTYSHATVTGGATVITAVDLGELRAAIPAIW